MATAGFLSQARRAMQKALLSVLTLLPAGTPVWAGEPFDVVEASIPEMQAAMAAGRVTARELVTQHLLRIAFYEDRINATIAVNPRALEEADTLDRERRAGKVRGPLHGIPIALKDNIHTTDMPTTGGALAFAGLVPPYEATLVANLRAAGAILLAKTQMTELANWVAGPPGMPTNYNSLNGYGFNPYDPRRDPREATFDGRPALATGGSSSGTGTAASFWVANVGTETSGSILSPANANRLVGGQTDRRADQPLRHHPDHRRPGHRRSDGAQRHRRGDPARRPRGRGARPARPGDRALPRGTDYTQYLDRGALRGARIGIPRAYFYDAAKAPGNARAAGRTRMRPTPPQWPQRSRCSSARARSSSIPPTSPASSTPTRSGTSSSGASAAASTRRRRKLLDRLRLRHGARFQSLADLAGPGRAGEEPDRAPAVESRPSEAPGRSSTVRRCSTSRTRWIRRSTARATRRIAPKTCDLTATHGIDEAMAAHRLDALLFPGSRGANLAARPGYPTVMVPFATVAAIADPPFPEGFDPAPLALGVSFTGTACSEPRLLALAYSFEQATRARLPPPGMP